MNVIRHRVGIRAPISEIFEAVHQPEKLSAWWATSARGTGAEGTKIELEFPGYPNHVWEISRILADQQVCLKLVSGPEPWRGSELQFDLLDEEGQVFLTLSHTTGEQTPESAYLYFCTKWPMFLVSLKSLLETGKGMPYPNDIKIQHP